MNICARLALSQLKTSRSRTAWALAALILSTALTTAVSSFAASGAALLEGLLGADYGEYGGTYKSLLLIPAVIMGLLIAAMSIIVISNVFRVSARERRAQFGTLKCVGATDKQISSSVIYEALFLSSAGIPLGLLAGLCLTLVGIRAVNINLSGLDALVHLMIRKVHLEAQFVLSWKALLISALISLSTVLLSAWLPARRAAREIAIDCVRGTGKDAHSIEQGFAVKAGLDLIGRLFGFEGVLAARNFRRSRRSFRATVCALSAGISLFICLASLSGMADKLEKLMLPDIRETVLAEYSSARTWETDPDTGLDASVYIRPIDSGLGNAVTERLEEYRDMEVFGAGLDLESYHTRISADCLTPEFETVLENLELPAGEFAVEIITLDDENYRLLCEKADVPVGSNILLNNYRYNNSGHETDIVPFTPALSSIALIKADGSRSVTAVDGMLTLEQMPKELIYLNMNPVRLVLPEAEVRGWAWYALPENEDEYIDYARCVMAEFFPEGEQSEYMQAGFNTRVYRLTDYVKVMNIAITLLCVLLYSFAALLMLIGFTNVISTVSANVLLRRREFAVLQSVGMTAAQLRRMLALESLLCSGRALLIGLPAGTAASALMSLPISLLYPIPWSVPWTAILLCSAAVLAITLTVTAAAALRLRRQNIIESIRSELT